MAVLKRFSYDNIVEHNPTAPDPVEGGGEGGGDGGGAKDTYVVFLSNDGVLKYRDGETDVVLLPSNIPANNGLISIIYVERDEILPAYHYSYLTNLKLDLHTHTPGALDFKGANSVKEFVYNATAGGFIVSGTNDDQD